jgi:hypothetical protein
MNLRLVGPPILAIMSIAALPIQTDAVMQLLPPIQEIACQRGQKAQFQVTIINNGDDDVPSRFSVHDMEVTLDGYPFVADSGATRGCGGWITLAQTEQNIRAHESFALKGTITVPRTAEGGYYALVRGQFVGSTLPLGGENGQLRGSAISIENQAVVALLLTVPSSRVHAEILPETLMVYPHGDTTATHAGVGFESKRGWKAVLRVRNMGNVHTTVGGRASLWSESGASLGSGELRAGRGYVLPTYARDLTADGDHGLGDGYYIIRIALQTGERSRLAKAFPFAVVDGRVYAGARNDRLDEILKLASPGFVLRDPMLQRPVTPGGASFLTVTLTSTSRDTITLLPRVVDWSIDPDGQLDLSKPTLDDRSCRPWIETLDDTLHVPPGRGATLRIKALPPADAAGEYYAAVVFDPDQFRPESPAEFMVNRAQLVALRTARGQRQAARIDSVSVRRQLIEAVSLTSFTITVVNTGNTHCYVMGNLGLEREVSPEVYKSVDQSPSFGDANMFLLPGGRRTFHLNLPGLESGTYRVVASVTYAPDVAPTTRYQRVVVR